MLYLKRDEKGEIIGLTATPTSPDAEEASMTDPMVRKFLESTDTSLIRVLEDVIDLLCDQGVIRFTDLPAEAQAKLMHRKSARSHLNDLTNLIGDKNDLV